MRMTTVAGKTNGASSPSTCLSPSSAESTEIAGVMIASPQNNAAPATPMQENDRRAPAQRDLGQRLQRQNAAFALVVRLHEEQHVFRRHDDQQRPDDQRHDADDLTNAEAGILEMAERGLQRVERAGADVAEHDADRAQRQEPEIAGGVRSAPRAVTVVRRRDGGGR